MQTLVAEDAETTQYTHAHSTYVHMKTALLPQYKYMYAKQSYSH